MIIFDFTCNLGHSFEGWFQSQENFEAQIEDGMLTCPHCGSAEVRRIPSAIHLSSNTSPQRAKTDLPAAQDFNAEGMISLLSQVLTVVLSNSEDVGKNFASEARRIHYLETSPRAIRGEASIEEFEDLQNEGIDVLMLPVVKKEEFH